MKAVWWGTLVLVASVALPAHAYEEPEYALLATRDGIEYRLYEATLVAETFVEGAQSRDGAANQGFRRLFAYISGANEQQTDIAMTVPVRQRAGVKIDMTAPVRQVQGERGWQVAFVVPSKYTAATAPQPTDPAVRLSELPAQTVAVLRFSGRWTNANIERHKQALLAALERADIAPLGEVTTAFYNAPFSLPFMRRNEVMVQVASTLKF